MISGLLFFYGVFCYCFPLKCLCSLHSLASNESSDCNIFSGATQSSVKSSYCVTNFPVQGGIAVDCVPLLQDVVLWAHIVQAEGIGGWESCGGALTSPTSNVVCKGKIPDSKAKVFHMTKTIICLCPLLCSNLSEGECFKEHVAKKVENPK